MAGPLAGARIIELQGRGPGPFAAMMLADLGADVIRVTRAGDVRLFSFHADCRVDGELRLSLGKGQAGLFTEEELSAPGGIVWKPQASVSSRQ